MGNQAQKALVCFFLFFFLPQGGGQIMHFRMFLRACAFVRLDGRQPLLAGAMPRLMRLGPQRSHSVFYYYCFHVFFFFFFNGHAIVIHSFISNQLSVVLPKSKNPSSFLPFFLLILRFNCNATSAPIVPVLLPGVLVTI